MMTKAMPGLEDMQRRDVGGRIVPVHEPETMKLASTSLYDGETKARIDALPRGQRSFGNLARGPQRAASLRLLTPTDCATSPMRGYIVKGLIAPGDLFLMVAKPGGGKSALAPSIGYAIAQGQPVFGRRTKPGVVLYVPVEDPHGMRQRVHALKRERGDAPNFLTVEGVSDLFSPDSPDPAALLEVTMLKRPSVIVIDTLAAAWRGMEENEGRDMARVISICRGLTNENCAVMLLCHPNKMQMSDGTARGHSSLNGEADVGLFLEWTTDGSAIVPRMTKNRNGPAYGGGMAFNIRSVRVGTDEDGEAISAPVACEVEAAAFEAKRKPNADAIALGFLTGLIASKGHPLPETVGYPVGLCGVTEEEWRRDCDSQRLSTADSEANRTRAFRRAFANLLRRKAVGARDGLIWIPQAEALL